MFAKEFIVTVLEQLHAQEKKIFELTVVSNALVSAICYLREYPDLAGSMGQHGRALVETRFDYDQLTATLDSHIATLLGKSVSADRDKVAERHPEEVPR